MTIFANVPLVKATGQAYFSSEKGHDICALDIRQPGSVLCFGEVQNKKVSVFFVGKTDEVNGVKSQ